MNNENDDVKKFKGRPLFENVHKVKQTSLLSHKSLEIDMKGFLNLVVIIICTVNFRLILERIKKHGFVMNFPQCTDFIKNAPIFVCFFCLNISIFFSWFIERHVTSWFLYYSVNDEVANAELVSAELVNAELGNAELGNAELGNAELGNAELGNAELGNAELGNAELVNAELVNAELVNAELVKDKTSDRFLQDRKNCNMKELTNCGFLEDISCSRASDEVTNDGSVQSSGNKSPAMIRCRKNVKKIYEEEMEKKEKDFSNEGTYQYIKNRNVYERDNKNGSKKRKGWKNFHLSIFLLRCINSIFILILPYLTVTYYDAEPFLSSILLTISIVWFFKIYSFHQVCYDTRKLYIDEVNLENIKDLSFEIEYVKNYPYCLKLKNYFTYMLMPTMCFQYTYPRTEKTNWLHVAKYSVEAILLTLMIRIILDQYIFITIENTFTMKEFQSAQFTVKVTHIIERMLKISIGTLYIWLIGFLVVFHHWCNILAEVTRFDDRLFYKDWWNANSFAEYWRKWNLPIHYFVCRHINKPLIYYGFNRKCSMIIVFFISALLHEYLISIPLKLGFSGYIFFFFIGQVPLIQLTNNDYFKKHKTTGNSIFWIVFCITGQPLIVFIYYYSWISRKGILHR
ncbi:diacylglycerol O-acyltransferase [Plasmodium gonderi]|uniref:O-acyltransferase n=1 Tax=Plasmodium gonderi TaxID=77519 RepID=A0A1Y1JDJ4_PLAGO|nr:diacylglycerol O-acyltransferase [Plasmodium gonderi]GAW80601.1 diacylglycerol O-acyltransferase [Plasmodium gonderi]